MPHKKAVYTLKIGCKKQNLDSEGDFLVQCEDTFQCGGKAEKLTCKQEQGGQKVDERVI
ncbi:MAG: hypothetical protein PHY02_00495 [Phycisphaerae bacterium]|nr:hypothetical protein [Phycisphaerae bacterium]